MERQTSEKYAATDLSRTGGTSNGIELDRLNWGNYDLFPADAGKKSADGGWGYLYQY